MLSKLTVARHLEFIAKYFYRAEEINGPLEEYKFSIGQRAENHLTLIFLSSSGWAKTLQKNCKNFYHGFGETTFLWKFVRNSLLCHISWKLKLVYFDFNSQVRATPHNILWIIYQRGTYILLIGFLFKTKHSVKRSKEGTSKDILSLTKKFCSLKHKQFDFFYLNVVELEIYFFYLFSETDLEALVGLVEEEDSWS